MEITFYEYENEKLDPIIHKYATSAKSYKILRVVNSETLKSMKVISKGRFHFHSARRNQSIRKLHPNDRRFRQSQKSKNAEFECQRNKNNSRLVFSQVTEKTQLVVKSPAFHGKFEISKLGGNRN